MSDGAEVRCACGALNDVGFGRCIRCAAPLGAEAAAMAPAGAARSEARTSGASGRPVPAPGLGVNQLGRAGMLLGGLTSLVFLMQLVLALRRGRIPLLDAGHVSDALRVGALLVEPDWLIHEPFRMLSAVYVHFGLVHFAFNMFGFIRLARTAEHFVGTSRTIIAFVTTGVFGFGVTAAYQLLSLGSPTLTAGASGGILGVMGLLLGILIRRRDPRWKAFAMETIFYTAIFGLAVNMSNAGFAVNNAAHFGGLAAGVVLGFGWGRTGSAESPLSRIVAQGLMAASALSLLLSQLSDRYRLLDF